jgi:hypothetical protein
VRFTVLLVPSGTTRHPRPPLVVSADEHAVEGSCHVFRRDTSVLGRPRSVVALRLPVVEVAAVHRGDPEPP